VGLVHAGHVFLRTEDKPDAALDRAIQSADINTGLCLGRPGGKRKGQRSGSEGNGFARTHDFSSFQIGHTS
jgi:hypothetical protein